MAPAGAPTFLNSSRLTMLKRLPTGRPVALALLAAIVLISALADAEPIERAASSRPTTDAAPGPKFVPVPASRRATTKPAPRVVYVIDATGTMLGLKFELLQ